MALPISLKLDIIRALLTGASMMPMIETLPAVDILSVHRFVWEKTLEFGIKTRGKQFPQEELQSRLRSISQAQISRGCPADLKTCQLYDCYQQQPECMRAMALQQIEAMCSVVQEYLNL